MCMKETKYVGFVGGEDSMDRERWVGCAEDWSPYVWVRGME